MYSRFLSHGLSAVLLLAGTRATEIRRPNAPASEMRSDLEISARTVSSSPDFALLAKSTRSSAATRLPLNANMLSQSGMAINGYAAIVDGDVSTHGWHTDNASAGAYLQIDLGSAATVLTVSVFGASSYAGIYDIRYSDDGNTWSTAASGFNPGNGWRSKSWPSVGAHRYWRLVLVNTPGPGSWLDELMLSTAAGPILAGSMLSQSGLAINTFGSIVDGDTTSAGWHTDSAVPGAYLQLDLGQAFGLTTVGIWVGSPANGIYDVKYSDDATTWLIAVSGYNPIPGWSAISWASVGQHRYWRLVLTNTPGPGAWLRELSVDPAQFDGDPPNLSSAMISQSGMSIGSLSGIVDHDTTTTGWHTDSSVPGSYLQFDLGSAAAWRGVAVWSGPPYYGVYDIKYSNDGVAWGTAARGYQPTSGWSGVSWGPVGKHRYWRLVLTNTPGPGAWLREFAVAPVIVLTTGGLNAQTNITKSECLTISTGSAAAFECGDLRIVHPLPAVTTMNKRRAPTLIYNSRHARPGALVAANLIYVGSPEPTSIDATLTIPGKSPITRSFAWSSACLGRTCRIVIPIDAAASGLTTGIYEYTLSLQPTNGQSSQPISRIDTLVIVDRSSSPFGAGWWLDGLEQLITVDASRKLWIGGDGSTRLFLHQGASSYWVVQPTVDRPDTLEQATDGHWRRHLPGGAYVEFDASGAHIKTVNRAGHVTSFSYNATIAGSPLQYVTLPVPAGSPVIRRYGFVYATNGANQATGLQSVTAPAIGSSQQRVVQFGYVNTRWLNSITDPDNRSITFSYDASNMLVGRRNKLTDNTIFAYDEGGALRQASVDISRTNGAGAAITTTFCPAETRSLSSCASGPQLLGQVYTSMDGPRSDVTDVTKFFVNRFGAPDTVINALGEITRIQRQDTRFPMLATSVFSVNGHETRMAYSSLALPDSSTSVDPYDQHCGNSTCDATTKYTWDPRWASILTTTLAEGEVTRFSYDAATGMMRTRTQVGNATSPDRVDSLFYIATDNLLDRVRAAGTASPSRIFYDSLGNARSLVSPLGFQTKLYADAAGRDTLVTTQIVPQDTLARLQRRRIYLDVLDQDTLNVATGPTVNTGTLQLTDSQKDSILVHSVFDAEGRALSVTRWVRPDINGIDTVRTAWEYDAAGRKHREVAADGNVDVFDYDPAGNITMWTTRRQHSVATTYDAINRPLTRTASGAMPTPEVTQFTYDVSGAIQTANNPFARITRHYFSGGAQKDETQDIATYNLAFGTHLYSLSYTYDKNGRRKSLTYPLVLTDLSGTPDVLQYGYNAQSDLASLARGIQAFGFGYDAAGRLDSLKYANGVYERSTFDDDGRLLKRFQRGPNYQGFISSGRGAAYPFQTDTIHSDLFAYDARGKTLYVSAITDSIFNVYQGLGALYTMQHQSLNPSPGAWQSETYQIDPLGNQRTTTYQQLGMNDGTSSYTAHTGRLYKRSATGITPNDTIAYDAAGNEAWRRMTRFEPNTEGTGWIQVADSTVNSYDADGRLRSLSMRVRRISAASAGTLHPIYGPRDDAIRYDALGRRVWTRTDYSTTLCGMTCTNFGSVQRFIWDGAQILGEIRDRPDRDVEDDHPIIFDTIPCTISAEVSCDSARARPYSGIYSPHVGRVQYVHAGGIDQPVLVVRRDYGGDSTWFGDIDIYPHANWRGSTDQVTFANGSGVYSSAQNHPIVELPGKNELAFRITKESGGGPQSWTGSLLAQQRDASGLMYMRSRYYDPQTGRFTQEDPIGLAGGLNVYGFAGGDPVNFADPFGLCPPCTGDELGEIAALVTQKTAGLKVITDALTSVTPVGDLLHSANAFAAGNKGEGLLYGAMAIGSLVPGGEEIEITAKGAAHALARHFVGGAETAGKSIFHAGEDLTALVRGAEGTAAVKQAGGNFERVVTAGREIGVDRATGSGTNVYTVITNTRNQLVTLFPGIPKP